MSEDNKKLAHEVILAMLETGIDQIETAIANENEDSAVEAALIARGYISALTQVLSTMIMSEKHVKEAIEGLNKIKENFQEEDHPLQALINELIEEL